MNAALSSTDTAFPRLRWLGVLWLLVYLPAYTLAYGAANFLFLCNIGVIVTAIGLILRNRLLVSSQAVAAPIIALVWISDAGWRLLTGDFLFGGTRYMWDDAYPLFTRLLSLYHVAWPLLLAWVLARTGYDRRGWALQSAIAALALVAGRWLGPRAENITTPGWTRSSASSSGPRRCTCWSAGSRWRESAMAPPIGCCCAVSGLWTGGPIPHEAHGCYHARPRKGHGNIGRLAQR